MVYVQFLYLTVVFCIWIFCQWIAILTQPKQMPFQEEPSLPTSCAKLHSVPRKPGIRGRKITPSLKRIGNSEKQMKQWDTIFNFCLTFVFYMDKSLFGLIRKIRKSKDILSLKKNSIFILLVSFQSWDHCKAS